MVLAFLKQTGMPNPILFVPLCLRVSLPLFGRGWNFIIGNSLFDIGYSGALTRRRGGRGAFDFGACCYEHECRNASTPFLMTCEPGFPESQCLPENKKAAHDGRPVVGKFRF